MMYVLPALRYEVLCAHPGLLEQGSTFSPEIEELQFDCFPQRPRCCSQGALFVEIACSVGTLSAYKPRPERTTKDREEIGIASNLHFPTSSAYVSRSQDSRPSTRTSLPHSNCPTTTSHAVQWKWTFFSDFRTRDFTFSSPVVTNETTIKR